MKGRSCTTEEMTESLMKVISETRGQMHCSVLRYTTSRLHSLRGRGTSDYHRPFCSLSTQDSYSLHGV